MDIDQINNVQNNTKIIEEKMSNIKIEEPLMLQKNPRYKNINSSNILNAYYY